MDHTRPNDVANLREANAQLRRKLEEISHSGSDTSTESDNIAQLRNENVELRERLLRYKALEEEVAAQRVFQKAKKLLLTWLTVGGSLLTLASLLGLMEFDKYAKRLVDEKLKTVTEEKVNKTIEEEGKLEVSKLIGQRQQVFDDFARTQIQSVIALMPIGKTSLTTAGVTSLGAVTVSQIDYTSAMNPIRNEGSESSVVGFALAAALEYQVSKKFGRNIVLSPREIYNLSKPFTPSDTGANISEAITMLTKTGAVPEDVWPYRAGEFAASPPQTVKTAQHYKVTYHRPLSGLNEIKAALQYYGPVAAGVLSYDSFFKGAGGMVPMPQPGERIQGATAICIVGFDDSKQLIKFRYSLGADWGDHGYGYLKYDYVDKNVDEAWLVSL